MCIDVNASDVGGSYGEVVDLSNNCDFTFTWGMSIYSFTNTFSSPSASFNFSKAIHGDNRESYYSTSFKYMCDSLIPIGALVEGSFLVELSNSSKVTMDLTKIYNVTTSPSRDINVVSSTLVSSSIYSVKYLITFNYVNPIEKFGSLNFNYGVNLKTGGTLNDYASITVKISNASLGYREFIPDLTVEEHIKEIDKNTKEQAETSKGIFASIKDFFGSFFQNLIDSVIGLFVPSSDEMSDLFGQLNDFFSDTFGFLYAPFDYLIRLIGVFTSSSGTTGLTLPGFSIMGHEVWGNQTYDIASDPVAGKVLEYVRIGTGVLLSGWFIMYLQDFFKERFGKG